MKAIFKYILPVLLLFILINGLIPTKKEVQKRFKAPFGAMSST